jgi:type VI secretion system protein ImpA
MVSESGCLLRQRDPKGHETVFRKRDLMSDLGSLVPALSEAAPCGEDLEYDPQFLEMELAGSGKPEQQYGATLIPAKPPDWPVVLELASSLAQRTHDIRVAMWQLRAGARLGGWAGAVEGLRLLQGLLAQHWEHVHPQLDAANGNSPLLRLSSLAPLTPQENPYPAPPLVLGDLREARLLPGDRNSPSIRDIELGMRAADPLAGELAPTETGILAAVRALLAKHDGLAHQMTAALQAVDGIVETLTRHLPASDRPDLTQVRKLLEAVARAAQRASGNTVLTGDGIGSSMVPIASGSAVAVGGTVNSRADVSRAIDQLCDWLERTEPSHPAPLLLRRAQRLLNKNFLEIIRDIAPDGTDQVVRLAGRPDKE